MSGLEKGYKCANASDSEEYNQHEPVEKRSYVFPILLDLSLNIFLLILGKTGQKTNGIRNYLI